MARESLRARKEGCVRMAAKVADREVGEVSVGKVSMMESGDAVLIFCETCSRDSGRRARRAMARLPCEGCERMRAMPVPCGEVGADC